MSNLLQQQDKSAAHPKLANLDSGLVVFVMTDSRPPERSPRRSSAKDPQGFHESTAHELINTRQRRKTLFMSSFFCVFSLS